MQNLENQPKRHGCVTAWLVVMIVIYMVSMVLSLISTDPKHSIYRFGLPQWIYFLLAFICILNIFFAVFIFKWKKWAFWGFVTTTIITVGINIYAGDDVRQGLMGLFGMLILFATLQIKEDGKSAWENLE